RRVSRGPVARELAGPDLRPRPADVVSLFELQRGSATDRGIHRGRARALEIDADKHDGRFGSLPRWTARTPVGHHTGETDGSRIVRTGAVRRAGGRVVCSGSFADGRPLASDVAFTPRNDGRSLTYHHADRAPNGFIQDATWGPDAANDAVVSLAFAGNQTALGPQLFVAKEWSASKIVFVAQALTSPPFRTNRFTYALANAKTLNILWEVERDGTLATGDRLACARSASSGPAAKENRNELVPGRVETAAAAPGSLDDLMFLQGRWVG